MAFFTDTHTANAGLAERFNAITAAFKEARARRKVYNQTLNELCKLTNRELADMGMARANIRSIAYEAAYHND